MLNLMGCNVDDSALKLIAKHCFFQLETIQLGLSNDVTDEGVIHLVTACTALRTVHLEQCRNVSDAALRSIAKLGTSLEDVSFKGSYTVTNETMRTIYSR